MRSLFVLEINKSQEPAFLQANFRWIWDRVHAALASNCQGTKNRGRKNEAAPLAKKLYDDEGKALVRVDSSKNGRRYRYYVSQKLLIKSDGTGWRLPGKEIEATLLHVTRKLMKDPAALSLGLLDANVPIAATSEIIKASVETADRMTDGVLMKEVIERAVLTPEA